MTGLWPASAETLTEATSAAPVRQIAGLVDEAEHVDDRHRDQRPAQALEIGVLQQAADHLDAVEFVAVNRGADQQGRSLLPAVDDLDRDVQRGMGVQLGRFQFDAGAGSRGNTLRMQLERWSLGLRTPFLGRSDIPCTHRVGTGIRILHLSNPSPAYVRGWYWWLSR